VKRLALLLLLLARDAHADSKIACTDDCDAIAARLAGQTIARDAGAIRIVDVAGEGAPRVGIVARDGEHLVLITADERLRLAGPLARPRIAGPGYAVWVIGTVARGDVPTLTVRRLGILRRPLVAK
jgi:hypothetical protein